MKKLLLSIALIFTLGFGAYAQTDVFFTWKEAYDDYDRIYEENYGIVLPSAHGNSSDFNTPLGSGLLVLTALGGAYALAKRRK
jgi:hypothetical protein